MSDMSFKTCKGRWSPIEKKEVERSDEQRDVQVVEGDGLRTVAV
jgi:hypothetical protein